MQKGKGSNRFPSHSDILIQTKLYIKAHHSISSVYDFFASYNLKLIRTSSCKTTKMETFSFSGSFQTCNQSF